ncbi:MAG: carboxypeptidase regulatory-like domain-containing protein, partial [Candidatus Krumholzibacteriia bacterium]
MVHAPRSDAGPPTGLACLALLALFLAAPAAAGTVCGHITDADTGQPVAGAGVFVREPAGQYAGALAVSDAAGAWCIDGLAAGTYTLEFRVDDYVSAFVSGVVVTSDLSDVPVALTRAVLVLDPPWPNPASGAVKLRLHLARSAPVELRIHDARGRLVRAWIATDVAAGPREYLW